MANILPAFVPGHVEPVLDYHLLHSVLDPWEPVAELPPLDLVVLPEQWEPAAELERLELVVVPRLESRPLYSS